MMAATHLVRVEGVNLSAARDDTDDISVRRGASAMLRTAARGLPAEFPRLRAVTFEASVGIFEMVSDDPAPLLAQIADHLSRTYPHVTFVVDAAPLDQGFENALNEAVARNRFRQFQQPTVAIPKPEVSSGLVCALDRVRPAAVRSKQGKWVSRSVADRLNEGRCQRDGFLSDILGAGYAVATTDNLHDLSKDPVGRYGNLAEKIAVIYLDGNSFGDLKKGSTATVQTRRALDDRIQGYRREFLRHLVESARRDPDFFNDGALRLEILMWGGDEILLVVPAWKGMETLQRFYEVSAGWFVPTDPSALSGDPWCGGDPEPAAAALTGKPLTHAGGIVFCSHNTPIAESTKSAQALAEAVKEITRKENRFDYLVLESIDYPTQALDAFRQLRYGAAAAALKPLAPFAQRPADADLEHLPWDKRVKKIAEILEELPRGALYSMAQAWVHSARTASPSGATPDHVSLDDRVARLIEVNGKDFVARLQHQLFDYLIPDYDPASGHDHPGWLHLVELWDYLAPLSAPTRRG